MNESRVRAGLAPALLFAALAGIFGVAPAVSSADVRVADADGLRRAGAAAKPGTRILLEPGEYRGGFSFSGLKGEAGKPIVIGGADPKRPPTIRGGGSGIQLSDPEHVEIENLVVSGATGNGINIDDGGSFDTPAHHVVIRAVTVADVGPRGNRDGIKLSGLTDFRVEGSTIERWGSGGSAIDMVGCHRGVIEKNAIRENANPGANGVQAKGGSSRIAVRENTFADFGGRGVNIGGSTGRPYFRPPLPDKIDAEASLAEGREIVVEGNVFVGGDAAMAFVGADSCTARFNTIYRPRRWALRILQENREPDFVECRGGEFSDNVVAFDARSWGGAANIGPNTAPGTFRFARNVWYALDEPTRSEPRLPTVEKDGISGRDPQFVDPDRRDFAVRKGSPAEKAGAHAYRAAKR